MGRGRDGRDTLVRPANEEGGERRLGMKRGYP